MRWEFLRTAWQPDRIDPWYWQEQPYDRVVATRATALGDYPRAQREQLRPDDVGLMPGTRRRVPGLRRGEVATLAGISSAYYLRLEQGHDIHPSAQDDRRSRASQVVGRNGASRAGHGRLSIGPK